MNAGQTPQKIENLLYMDSDESSRMGRLRYRVEVANCYMQEHAILCRRALEDMEEGVRMRAASSYNSWFLEVTQAAGELKERWKKAAYACKAEICEHSAKTYKWRARLLQNIAVSEILDIIVDLWGKDSEVMSHHGDTVLVVAVVEDADLGRLRIEVDVGPADLQVSVTKAQQ